MLGGEAASSASSKANMSAVYLSTQVDPIEIFLCSEDVNARSITSTQRPQFDGPLMAAEHSHRCAQIW